MLNVIIPTLFFSMIIAGPNSTKADAREGAETSPNVGQSATESDAERKP